MAVAGLTWGIVLIIALILFYVLWACTSESTESFANANDDALFAKEKPPLLPVRIFTISDTFAKLAQDLIQGSGLTAKEIKYQTDVIPGWIKDNMKCFTATEPQYVQERVASIDCGWWLNEDDGNNMRQSFSILGTQKEPVLAKQLAKENPTGRWIWDMKEAQEAEDRKICKRLTVCEIADLIPGKCGFCPSLNMGIPIDKDGTSLYKHDLACTGDVITNPFKCPVTPETSRVCQPDPKTGQLSKDCLLKIAKALGGEEQGVIIHILKGDKNNYERSFKFAKAKQVLLDTSNIGSRDAFYGQGVCSRYEAMTYYYKIAKVLMDPAAPKQAVNAAMFLLKGGEFDECQRNPDTKGPFELGCIQLEALKNSFQHDGALYPKTENDSHKFDDMTWQQVQEYFQSKSCALQSNKADTFAKALKDVYGIDAQIQNYIDVGSMSGLSYYVYAYDQGCQAPTYYGRQVAQTFPDFDNSEHKRKEYLCSRIKTKHSLIKFQTQIVVSEPVSETNFQSYADDGIKIKVNDKTVLNKWMDQEHALAFESNQFNIDNKKDGPTKLEVLWYNNSPQYTFSLRVLYKNSYQSIPESVMYQIAPTLFPVARWDFYQGTIDDRCGIIKSQLFGSPSKTILDNKVCVLFKDKIPCIQLSNPLYSTSFKTITMMVNLQKTPYGPVRLWSMHNSTNPHKIVAALSKNNDSGMVFECAGGKLHPNTNLPLNEWCHIAWSMDDTRGIRMYVNGQKVSGFDQPIDALKDKIFDEVYILGSKNESYDKEIGCAWFRIYDYIMTEEQVQLDMNNRFAMPLIYPTDESSGWKA